VQDGGLSSQTLEQLSIELERLRADLEKTWLWRPNLNLSVSASVPLEDFQASVSLSFSPNDLKNDERSDLAEAVQEKLDDISTERFSLEVERDIQTRSVSMAEQVLAMNRVELEQAQISLDEASLLFQQGFLTEIELSQTTLSVKAAEIRAFSAAYDLYQILGELLFLYRGIR
jgi:hypothetical protein